MHGAEGVRDVQLGHVSQFLGKGGSVLLLAGIKAQVLQQHDLAALQSGGLGLGVIAHHILGENDLLPQQLAQPHSHGSQRQLFLPLTLGLAQMGAGDHRRALIQQILDGGQGSHDALVAGDGAGGLVLRYVEIAAQQDLFACHIHVHNGLLVVIHIPFSFIRSLLTALAPPFRPRRTDRENPFAAALRR